MYLEIPDELQEAFVSLIELCLDEVLLSFGPDLSKDEIRVVELLKDSTSKGTS